MSGENKNEIKRERHILCVWQQRNWPTSRLRRLSWVHARTDRVCTRIYNESFPVDLGKPSIMYTARSIQSPQTDWLFKDLCARALVSSTFWQITSVDPCFFSQLTFVERLVVCRQNGMHSIVINSIWFWLCFTLYSKCQWLEQAWRKLNTVVTFVLRFAFKIFIKVMVAGCVRIGYIMSTRLTSIIQNIIDTKGICNTPKLSEFKLYTI